MSSISVSYPPGINEFPDDILLEIFPHLDSRTVLLIIEVCKRWQVLSNEERPYERIFYRDLVFFGPKEWKKNWGDPDTVPKISYKQAVKEAFIFARGWPEEWDRKMVWLQPKEILQQAASEEPKSVLITPRKIGEMVASKLGGKWHPSGYRFFWDEALREHGDTPVEESCWGYMTPDVHPDSLKKSWDVQKKQAEDFGGEAPELPWAATGSFLYCLVTGKRLFRSTYTRCKESTQGQQLVFGGFAPAGPSVDIDFGLVNDGVAVLRKFKGIGT
jgi:hypothetical protein